MSSPPVPHPVAPPPVGWPRRTFETSARDIALTIIPLLLHPSLWIHRRKETFTFRDDTRLRRRVTVDFTLPVWDRPSVSGTPATRAPSVSVVPISLLEKRPLKDFDLIDEEGRPVPILTTYQHGLVAEEVLTVLAERALSRSGNPHRPLRRPLKTELRLIATEPPVRAERLLKRFVTDGHLAKERQTIWESAAFRALAFELASSFFLLAQMDVTPGIRRTIKLGYEEELAAPIQLTWRQRFGLHPAEVWVPTNALGFGDSYHAEMLAPDELIVERATLSEIGTMTARRRDQRSPEDADGVAIRAARASLTELATETNVPRLHLMTRERARHAAGYLSIRLRLTPSGLLPATVLIAWLTAGLLGGGVALELTGFSANVEASAALLVALPALFSIVLTRPGEHGLVQRFVAGLRVMVIVSGLASFSAAAVLATDVGSTARFVVWSLGLFVTVLIAIPTTVAYIRAVALDRARASSDTVVTR